MHSRGFKKCHKREQCTSDYPSSDATIFQYDASIIYMYQIEVIFKHSQFSLRFWVQSVRSEERHFDL